MLTTIQVQSENAFEVAILGVSPKSSLLIRKVTGLNPPDIDLFIGDYARDGGVYKGRRVGKRNVVITVDLNPNPALGETISGLREMLYKAFIDPQVSGDNIRILLTDDLGRTRYLEGYVEKFETEIFDIETMCQISIICPDPFLRDNSLVTLTDPAGWTTVPFAYTGTAETGFETWIYVTTTTTPTLFLSNNYVPMQLTGPFVTGDIIKINTNRGTRTVRKVPGGTGTEVSILASLTATSPWLELHSQSNILSVYGVTPGDGVAAIRYLQFRPSYWGV